MPLALAPRKCPCIFSMVVYSVKAFLLPSHPFKEKYSMASEKVLTITDSSFDADVIKSDKPVLVDFWATWCAPCKAITPVIEAIAEEYDGRIVVGKVNVDDSPATPGKYGVRGIPTIILFNDGKVVDQVVGAVPKSQLEALIKKAL